MIKVRTHPLRFHVAHVLQLKT